MFYVRHFSQAHFQSNKDAWAYANKLGCDLDVYDSNEREVVWGTYRLAQLVEVDGKEAWKVLAYAKSLKPLRTAWQATKPKTWAVSHYDWETCKWTSVAHS